MNQIDVFGETQSLTTSGIEAPKPRDAIVQPRLFEPQMEGQLTLETERPAEAGRPDATTNTKGNTHGCR